MKSYESSMLIGGAVHVVNLIAHNMGAPDPVGWVLLGVATTLMVLSFADFIYKECK